MKYTFILNRSVPSDCDTFLLGPPKPHLQLHPSLPLRHQVHQLRPQVFSLKNVYQLYESKDGPYKNPEYYTFNAMSFYDIEKEMKQFRLPQPSSVKK